MNHAITVGGLLLSVGIIAGLIAAAVGVLMAFAGGMSDSPAEGEAASKRGCIVLAIGLALVGGCIAMVVL